MTWKRRIELIIKDIILTSKSTLEKTDEESKVQDLIAHLNDRIFIESKESGFNLTEKTVKAILQKSLENNWPTLKMANHQRIIKDCFNDIEFYKPKKCMLCCKRKYHDTDSKTESLATLL